MMTNSVVPFHTRPMDIEPRIGWALAIIAAIVVTIVPMTIRHLRRRRADKLRRRGIKSYNRSNNRTT